GIEQLVLGLPLGPAAAMVPALLGTLGLVDADEPRFLFLAVVGRRPRIAHHRHLLVALEELGHRLGDEVGVLHVGDGYVRADHAAHLAGVPAGGVAHHLAHHGALLGVHLPLSGRAAVDGGHAVAGDDGRAHVARAARQRVAAVRRVDVSVAGGPGPGQHAVGGDERVDLADLGRVDDLAVETDEPAERGDALEPLDLGRPRR